MEYYFSIATASLSVLSVAIQRSLQFQGWGWFSTFLRYTIFSLLLKEIQSLGGDGLLIKFALWRFFWNFPPGQKKLSIILVPLNNHIIVVQWGL